MGIKVWLDNHGIEQSMTNSPEIKQVEHEIMEQRLSEVQGQFIIDFGVEGNFVIQQRTERRSAKYGTVRSAFKIAAGDTRTAAILKRHPGWLAKFAE